MKKISILSLHLGYGGIEKSIVSLANILIKKYNVEIAVCYKLYDKPAFDLDNKVNVIYLNDDDIIPNRKSIEFALKKKKYLSLMKELSFSMKVLHYRKKSIVDYIKSTDSDVIISTRDIFNEWLSFYGKKSTFKIGWEHNHFHNNYKYANRIVQSAKKLDSLVLVSNNLYEYYNKALSNYPCKCHYIPNTLDEFPKNISKLNNKRLISIGRLSPEKGFLDLLNIFKKILIDYPDWTLDIIGDGSEKNVLEEYIKDNKLENSIFLHGFRDKKYIDNLLDKSSIYLMTSYTESFGIVLIEAMSHGLPCIAFDSAEGACEIINSGENGYLIKNRNFAMMIKKISDLINNYDERKQLGANARKSVFRFTSEIVAEEWYNLIEKSDDNE